MNEIACLSIVVFVRVTTSIEAAFLFATTLALFAFLAFLASLSGERPRHHVPAPASPPGMVKPPPVPAPPATRHLAVLPRPVPRWRTES